MNIILYYFTLILCFVSKKFENVGTCSYITIYMPFPQVPTPCLFIPIRACLPTYLRNFKIKWFQIFGKFVKINLGNFCLRLQEAQIQGRRSKYTYCIKCVIANAQASIRNTFLVARTTQVPEHNFNKLPTYLINRIIIRCIKKYKRTQLSF